jgi:hypothetical protein
MSSPSWRKSMNRPSGLSERSLLLDSQNHRQSVDKACAQVLS